MGVVRGLAATVALCACVAGRADPVLVHAQEPHSPVAIVGSDMLWGSLTGGVVGGAILGYRAGIQNQQGYDWVPVLVTGVGIGLAGGLVLGIVDALSSRPTDVLQRPAHDGMSLREMRPRDLSGQMTLPLWAARF